MATYLLVDSAKASEAQLSSGLGSYCAQVHSLDVPAGTKMPFDELNRITDESQKIDSGIESAVRRIERTAAEIDVKVSDLTITVSGVANKVEDYIGKFKWDRAAYPTSKSFDENWAAVQAKAQHWDKLTMTEATKYNELKATNTANEKNATAGLATRTLTDLLSPDVVNTTARDPDFVATEHLQTVLVVVPNQSEAEFLSVIGEFGKTEKFESTVISGSWRKFSGVADKENNELWRVVLFKAGLDQFVQDCRQRKWTAREFDYSEQEYRKCLADQKATSASMNDAKNKLANFIKTAYGELVTCWLHLKVMRLMADSYLRAGSGSTRKFYVLKLKPAIKEASFRSSLDSLLADEKAFGREYQLGDKAEGEDEYFPYASVGFQPQSITA